MILILVGQNQFSKVLDVGKVHVCAYSFIEVDSVV